MLVHDYWMPGSKAYKEFEGVYLAVKEFLESSNFVINEIRNDMIYLTRRTNGS